jgi:hypothetical protein
MIPLALAGAGLGLAGGIANMIGNSRANRKLEQLLQNNPKYAANPLAAQQLGLAQTLLNAWCSSSGA